MYRPESTSMSLGTQVLVRPFVAKRFKRELSAELANGFLAWKGGNPGCPFLGENVPFLRMETQES